MLSSIVQNTDFPLWGKPISVYQICSEITNAVVLDIYYKVWYREGRERWSLLLAKIHFPCNCRAVTFATKHKNTINVIYWESFQTYLFCPWTLNKDFCLPLSHYRNPLSIKIQQFQMDLDHCATLNWYSLEIAIFISEWGMWTINPEHLLNLT